MEKSYIKIIYSRRLRFGIPMPFYHTHLEICNNKKITKLGYFSLTDSLWVLSLLTPVPGEVRNDAHKADYSITVSKDPKKVKKVLKLVKSRRFRWRVYSAFFRNCFDWRNTILKEAGLKYPTKDWFWKITYSQSS